MGRAAGVGRTDGVGTALCDDLVDAQACIDWTLDQLPGLQNCINAWLIANVKVEVEDPDPGVPNNIIVAIQREELPRAFNVEIGAYLNTIRSSLDILATALTVRYRIGRPEDAYFPIAKTEAAFRASGKTSQFLAGAACSRAGACRGTQAIWRGQ
jgi:hypothetical protein